MCFQDHPVYQPSPSNGVKNAVSLLMDVDNVIGDGTAIFSLPTVKGKHSDLKSIDSNTVCIFSVQSKNIIMSNVLDKKAPLEFFTY